MTNRSKTPSKLLIPVALLAILAAGVAVTSPRKIAESPNPSASVSADPEPHDIRPHQFIFHPEDLTKPPDIWEEMWKREEGEEFDRPYRVHGSVL